MIKSFAALGLAVASLTLGLVSPGASAPESRDPSESSPSEVSRADGSRDPIREVLHDPDAFARARRLATLLPTLGPEALPEVRRALVSFEDQRGAVEIELLVRFWANHDPASAARWAFTESPLGFRTAAILPSVESWARADPDAASEWVRGLIQVPGGNTEAARVALVRGWFDSERPGLVEYIESLGPSFERQRALGVFARKRLRRDGAVALKTWAKSLPDEPHRFKLAAFRRVATELTRVDPALGVAWCEAHCEGTFGANLRKLVAAGWVVKDAPAAMAWLSKAPPGIERELAVRVALLTWLRVDQQNAFAWIDTIGLAGVESWLRQALDLYALPLSWEEPAEAVRWAAQIDDDQRRESTLVTIARRWRERDAIAAEAWLEKSPLSETAREQARTLVPKNTRPGRASGNADARPGF